MHFDEAKEVSKAEPGACAGGQGKTGQQHYASWLEAVLLIGGAGERTSVTKVSATGCSG